tara:strand:+ start:16540 stop:16977 length:438 start_codon:yes stop_codon:yes gene_type:complete
MVLTRSQKTNCVNDVLIFVDISGSTYEHITDKRLEDKVEEICNNTTGNVSLYISNHELHQIYFLNSGKKIPRQQFSFGGLSAVYDNILDAIDHRFSFDNDTPCDVYIISDMDDNVSMFYNLDDVTSKLSLMNNFWNISILHPANV